MSHCSVNEELADLRWLPSARQTSYTLREFRHALTSNARRSAATLETLLQRRTITVTTVTTITHNSSNVTNESNKGRSGDGCDLHA